MDIATPAEANETIPLAFGRFNKLWLFYPQQGPKSVNYLQEINSLLKDLPEI